MQIRTLLLIISLLGSALTAITVWVVSAQRETAQMQADSELRWQIYSDSWKRLESEELLELDKYGAQGKNQSFWRAENADPLASSTSVPIYSSDVDYSTAGIDSIANPVIRGIIEEKGSSRAANGLLRRFFGAPLQRGKSFSIQWYKLQILSKSFVRNPYLRAHTTLVQPNFKPLLRE